MGVVSKPTVWEYSLYGLDLDRTQFRRDACDAFDLAEQVAEASREKAPEITEVWVWRDGEFQGKFTCEPDIVIVWRAFKEDE